MKLQKLRFDEAETDMELDILCMSPNLAIRGTEQGEQGGLGELPKRASASREPG
jgi:hypothetical protein